MMQNFYVSTKKEEELVDITHSIQDIVSQAKIKTGLCNIYVPHATAALIINENADPNIRTDIIKALGEAVKKHPWLHDRIDNNAHAHIKSAILGPSVSVPIKDSELMLGTWQNLFLAEFNGPRKRKIIITVIKDAL